MAAAAQPGSTANASNSRVVVSVVLLVVVIAIIVFVAWIVHRIQPPIIVPAFIRNQRMREEEQHRKGIGNYVLESLPAVRYSTRLQLNEQRRVHEVHDSALSTYLPTRPVQSTIDGEQPLHISVEAAVMAKADEHKTSIPLREDASRNGGRSESRRELVSCSVCTEDFVERDNIRILPCNHIYHRRCIDPWLLDFAGTCPLW
jgi:hypothetical protein